MSDFADALDVPKEWVEDLLEELAGTHHVVFTCDERGTFRGKVNTERRIMLERVLGLRDVEYRVCEYCKTFELAENAEWEYPGVCPDCESEIPGRES